MGLGSTLINSGKIIGQGAKLAYNGIKMAKGVGTLFKASRGVIKGVRKTFKKNILKNDSKEVVNELRSSMLNSDDLLKKSDSEFMKYIIENSDKLKNEEKKSMLTNLIESDKLVKATILLSITKLDDNVINSVKSILNEENMKKMSRLLNSAKDVVNTNINNIDDMIKGKRDITNPFSLLDGNNNISKNSRDKSILHKMREIDRKNIEKEEKEREISI